MPTSGELYLKDLQNIVINTLVVTPGSFFVQLGLYYINLPSACLVDLYNS